MRRAFPSVLPSAFIYSLLPRLPFVTPSDSLFPTICLCLPYFRGTFRSTSIRSHTCPASYVMYIAIIVSPYLLDSIDYIINVYSAYTSRVYYIPFVFVCLSRYLSSQREIYLFITFRCLKYPPLPWHSFILNTPSSSIVTSLSSGYTYTVRSRLKPLFYPCPLFSFLQACSDSSPSSRLFPQSPQIVFSLSTFYTPPYDRPLAAPRFLNLYLSDSYSIRSLVHDRRGPPIFSLLDPPRIFVSVQLVFSFAFFRPLSPFLSIPFSPSRFHAHAGRRLQLSLLRAPPFSVAVRTGRAAPLAARKKGGPKRTSYFLCSDSDLGGPKWPPMM